MKSKIHLNWINLNKIDLLINTRHKNYTNIKFLRINSDNNLIIQSKYWIKKIKSYKILCSTKLNSLVNKIYP